jgi:hypothetical protein
MANPGLKAQIEAAKSALASDLAAPSLVTPPPKPQIMANNDIAPDAGTDAATDYSGNTANPIPANPIPADGNSAHASNATDLDERITRLEAKLLDNQRDLHTLLKKIREISRLQTNSGKSHKNRAKTMVNDKTKTNAEPRQSQRSPLIMVAMAILIGVVVGIAYFLVTTEGDLSALTMPSWFSIIIDRVNGWIG